MHMDRLERALSDGTCNAGKVFYFCQVNKFRGCCSVDPCALPACPDEDTSSTTAPISKSSSTSPPKSTQKSASIPDAILSSTLQTTAIQPTSTIIIAVISSTPTQTQTQTQSQTHTATSTPTPTPAAGVSKTPIIAGSVSGVVVLSILSILFWFCIRRRKQTREIRNSIAQYGVPNKEFVLDRTAPSESSGVGGDVFASFGGRFNEPLFTPAIPPPSSGQSTPKQTLISSREVYPTSGARSEIGDLYPHPTTPTRDRPIPDPEKSVLTPPPVHEPPFFHSLPGQPTGISEYCHGTPVNPNVTPTRPQESTMRSHPTYHISQLSTHPLLGASKSPPLPRGSDFSQRTSEVRRYRSSSPVNNYYDQNQSSSQSQQENQQAWRHSELSTTTTMALTSPILGLSELEAEVPSTYLSPTTATSSTTTAYNTPRSDFNSTNKHTQSRSLIMPISSENTDSTKYSIPIGLGVESKGTPKRDSSPFLQYRNSEVRRELDAPKQNIATPSISISTPTLGSNLNSPRDGEHVMSWAEAYGKVSASPSVSASGARDLSTKGWAQERVQDGSFIQRTSDEKEVTSPVPLERWSGATTVQMHSQPQSPDCGNLTPLSAESGGISELGPEAGVGVGGKW